MKVTESKRYSNRIISLEDLRKIEDLFEQEFQSVAAKSASEPGVSYATVGMQKSVSFYDDSDISFDYDAKSKNFQMLYNITDLVVRKCKSITIRFRSTEGDKRITVSINAGSGYSSGISADIAGDDRQFVSGFLASLSVIVDSIKPQNVFLKKIFSALKFAIILFVIAPSVYFIEFDILIPIMTFALNHLVVLSQPEIKFLKTNPFSMVMIRHPNGIVVFFDLLVIIWCILVAVPIYRLIQIQLDKMYSNIEFAFGPEHMREEVRARRTLYWIITIIVLPLLLSILTNFMH